MSGMKNLANAIANEPGFAGKCSEFMTKKEAAEFVPQNMSGRKGGGKKPGKGKGY